MTAFVRRDRLGFNRIGPTARHSLGQLLFTERQAGDRSDEDPGRGATPVVIARRKKGSVAYPCVFEARPGKLWITTMQGGLRVKLHERDFVGG